LSEDAGAVFVADVSTLGEGSLGAGNSMLGWIAAPFAVEFAEVIVLLPGLETSGARDTMRLRQWRP
jgi:hypothetical protein